MREIDALGGQMGVVTDLTAIQFRMLNNSKGAAMWSPRAQSDRQKYSQMWRDKLENTPHLSLWQDNVVAIVMENGRAAGVKTAMGAEFRAGAVVITAGTFLGGLIHCGTTQISGGRISEPSSFGITAQLREMGVSTARMKTGTPARLDGRTIDFDRMTRQDGENGFHKFSYLDIEPRPLRQRPCFLTQTNPRTHEMLREGLPQSPLYNGQIKSIGPRYCPSIETKIVTFEGKDHHPIFIEPEGETTQEYYVNGFSSSLPMDIQIAALQTIEGLEHVQLYRPGYAIEYDFFDPTQLTHSLESKVVPRLFMAGQVNGTTGYEEAAGQGLMAGINAHMAVNGGEPMVLARDEAYIGVLIDDLVTKGVDEPYRMFTSRAEYRILLRQDDADCRLTPKGAKAGLATPHRLQLLHSKTKAVNQLTDFMRRYPVHPRDINAFLESQGTTPLQAGCKLADLAARPQLTIAALSQAVPALKAEMDKITDRREETVEAAEIKLKYSGYIARETVVAEKLHRLEGIKIKGKFDYDTVKSLSTEARQKLKRIDPETIGQASRIPGVSPSDINILLVMMGR